MVQSTPAANRGTRLTGPVPRTVSVFASSANWLTRDAGKLAANKVRRLRVASKQRAVALKQRHRGAAHRTDRSQKLFKLGRRDPAYHHAQEHAANTCQTMRDDGLLIAGYKLGTVSTKVETVASEIIRSK